MESASLKRRRAHGVVPKTKTEPSNSNSPAALAAIDALPASARVATGARRVTPPANMSDTDATRCTDSENEYQARKRARTQKKKRADDRDSRTRDRAPAGVLAAALAGPARTPPMLSDILDVRPASSASLVELAPRARVKGELESSSSDGIRAHRDTATSKPVDTHANQTASSKGHLEPEHSVDVCTMKRNDRIYARWTQLKVIKEELAIVKEKVVSAMDKVEKMIDDECREWLNTVV